MHFLITAGGTREYIDPVRFISNASSGRMGYALAEAAVKAGGRVTLITAAREKAEPRGVRVVYVDSSEEMLAAVKERLAKCDCLIMAAAVSDYRPVKQAKGKIKKSSRSLVIKLKPTVDILKWASRNKKEKQVLVGFALEDRELRARAEKKMCEKKLDMIVANSPAAIGAEKTTVQIKTRGGDWGVIENSSKSFIAKKIIGQIEKWF